MTALNFRYFTSVFFMFCLLARKAVPLKRLRADQELLAMCRRTALKNMVRKIIQPWWMRKQIALTVARLPLWGLRCCRPKEPLSEPRRGEFRRRAANRRANRTGNAACQEIVFGSSWRYILHISFLKAHLLALRTRSIPRSKELGQFRFLSFKKLELFELFKY